MHSVQKPGADEAKVIKRSFEWLSKIRDIHRGLDNVSRDFKSAAVSKDESLKMAKSFDPDQTVKEVEDWAKSQFEPLDKKKAVNAYSFAKLNKALDVISRRLEDPLPSKKRFDKSCRNDWTYFEKIESERRAFVEASYRRYRLGEIDRPPRPKPEYFDYDQVEMKEDDQGASKQQPIAFAKRFDLKKAYDEELHAIRHTAEDEREWARTQRECFGHHASGGGVATAEPPRGITTAGGTAATYKCPIEREAFVSKLVSTKNRHELCATLSPGQSVSVCYYGIHFSGTILQRNIGNSTVRVQFDDGTVNDFPIQSIVVDSE